MGYANVSLVYARWGHLPDRPKLLLAYMALRSRDEDDPPIFYEGREACALAIGRLTPEAPATTDDSARADEFRRARRNDFEAVKVALRIIVKAGAASILQPPGPGRNAVYALHLTARTGKGYPVEKGRVTPSTGKDYPVERGRLSLPHTEVPPTGVPHENTTETTNSSRVGNSPAAVGIDFGKAMTILDSLPDKGAELLKRVEHVGGYENRRIAAARIHLAGRNAS